MKKLLLTGILFLSPLVSHAQVLFSEIAWMGSDASPNDEWIELYNLSETPTDVTGWTITLNDSLFITLTGTISPHGTAVLERSNDEVLPGTAFQVYTDALANSGVTLRLKDASGMVIDEVVGGTDWIGIGGSNVKPKMTPQRTRTGAWVTGVPTPGTENVQQGSPIPEGEADSDSDAEVPTSVAKQPSQTSRGGSSKKTVDKEKDAPKELSVTVRAPKIVYVNQPVAFDVTASGAGQTIINSLRYTWNYGDTYTGEGKSVRHSFSYPGEYVVFVEGIFARERATARHEITVLENSLEINRSDSGDVILKNTSKSEIDLGGYMIEGTESFMFPKFSFVKAGGFITIPKKRVGSSISALTLYDPKHVVVASDGISFPLLTEAAPFVQYGIVPQKTLIASNITASKVKAVEKTEDSATTTTEAQDVIPKSTVVQIGNTAAVADSNPSLLRRMWGKIASLFD